MDAEDVGNNIFDGADNTNSEGAEANIHEFTLYVSSLNSGCDNIKTNADISKP